MTAKSKSQFTSTNKPLPHPDELKNFSSVELRSLWKSLHPCKQAPHIKTLLIRELAYVIQEKKYGGFDKWSVDRLKTAKKDYLNNILENKPSRGTKSTTPPIKTKKSIPKITLSLEDSTTLKRQFNGRLYEVKVKNTDGKSYFIFNGKDYKSLSKIAEEITGTHWSGPRFFGLTKLRLKS